MQVFVTLQTEDDVYRALQSVRGALRNQGFSEMEEQMVVVSVSELTRNVLDHARTPGRFTCDLHSDEIQIEVTDLGPGIPDIERVLRGESVPSSRGLGLGLAGVQRLMDAFEIKTSEKGTTIVARKRRGQNKGR